MHCKYCGKYLAKRNDGLDHMERMHIDNMEQEGLDSAQALWLGDHSSLTGKCTCSPTCKEVTGWNPKTGKPYRVSPNPACRARIAAQADRNLAAVGLDKHTMLSDMQHQRDMLRNRKTSGKYRFSVDGGVVEYSSQLELNWLQFCDRILELPSFTIQEPPESFPYHDPKTNTDRWYAPDYYLPDYNLMVEIKDGGDKPNGNPAFIESTRYKVYLKDEAMKKQNRYNFIRISGKNYGAFMEILFNIVHDNLTEIPEGGKKHNTLCVITESANIEEVCPPISFEQVNVSTITLAVKYIGFTDLVQMIAITDSPTRSYWLATDYHMKEIKRIPWDEFEALPGTVRYFKYIGDPELMKRAYERCIEMTEKNIGMMYWDIKAILYFGGINFTDGGDFGNNDFKACDFIETGIEIGGELHGS